jgi:hypothetical protein
MEHPSPTRTNQKAPLIHEWPDCLEGDPRLSLSRRVVAGRHFAKSPLLSKFFLYVVLETLAGRQAEITEHQIGVQVFGRSPRYLTVEDNIVRNYARQLRRRLAEHFAGEGSSESLRVEIPHGGYIPVFTRASDVSPGGEQPNGPVPVNAGTHVASGPPPSSVVAIAPRWNWQRSFLCASALTACAAVLISLTWFVAARTHASRQAPEPAQPLWAALFDGPANSYIVPADAGFNLLEDLSRHPLPLADYIKGGYLELPLAQVDAHSAQDLRSQQFTSFVDLQIVTALARLPEFNPQRVILRFPRDLRLDDLKNANAVIIGSVGSNPWAAIAGDSTNFRITYREDMQGATLVNMKPQPGESPSYVSHWNEPAHETFAVISFLPNLSGNGHLLLLQGLDVAGTQAAAEVLFRQDALAPVLRRATRPDGSLRFFEVLLRSTSIQSSAAGTQVLALRIH